MRVRLIVYSPTWIRRVSDDVGSGFSFREALTKGRGYPQVLCPRLNRSPCVADQEEILVGDALRNSSGLFCIGAPA